MMMMTQVLYIYAFVAAPQFDARICNVMCSKWVKGAYSPLKQHSASVFLF